jgi:hypothetical protein
VVDTKIEDSIASEMGEKTQFRVACDNKERHRHGSKQARSKTPGPQCTTLAADAASQSDESSKLRDMFAALKNSMQKCSGNNDKSPEEALKNIRNKQLYLEEMQQLLREEEKFHSRRRSPLLSLEDNILSNIASFSKEEELWALEIAAGPQLDIDFFQSHWEQLQSRYSKHFPIADTNKQPGGRSSRQRGVIFARASRFARRLEESARIHYNNDCIDNREVGEYKWPDRIFDPVFDRTRKKKLLQSDFYNHRADFFVRISYCPSDDEEMSSSVCFEAVLDCTYFGALPEAARSYLINNSRNLDKWLLDKMMAHGLKDIDSLEDWSEESKIEFANRLWMTFVWYNSRTDRLELVISTGGCYQLGFMHNSGIMFMFSPRSIDAQDRRVVNRPRIVNAGIRFLDGNCVLLLNWGMFVEVPDDNNYVWHA